jgi:uncharacterized repeat protein (TIGR01451 family)
MKNRIHTIKKYMLLVFLLATTLTYAQIVLNTTPNTSTCNLSGDNVTVSVPSEALTGDNIALNITLPGSYDAGCVKTVSITSSPNLSFQSSGAIPFIDMGGGTYQNAPSPVLNGNDGHNFNVFFKFPGYVTCNGAVGTFNVTVTLDCAGVITTCTTSVSVVARADNYWTITKEFVTGDLTCGLSTWRIKLNHNNPNGSGLGTYKLTGTITESPSVPVVSGAVHTVNYSMAGNSFYTKMVTLQNCAPEGSTITNIANYNFTLGDGTCGTMVGTVSAVSDPLVSPNADFSFVKYAYDNNGYPQNHPYFNIPPGCSGKYRIQAHNNGNVPWTNIVITDNLNIPGITITGISPPPGWTVSPTIPPFLNTLYTFTAPPGFVLNPGEEINIWVDFEVNLGTSAGTTISNTANIDYQASGAGSGNSGNGGPSPCPGITCPTIDTSVQNTTTLVDFVVATPEPRGSIKKCILNPPSAIVPPIYQIGDIIEFSVMIGNSGAGNLTTTLTDAFGMPGQNLEIIPGSITYEYYADENRSYRNSCSPPFGAPTAPPFSVTANTTDLQNPFWNITNMPGICDYNRSNFLIIKFNAEILPQLHGTKTNSASIPSTTGAGTHTSPVNYSIDQVGVLGIFKEADTEIVENGQSFNYIITVSNNGSVPLDNIVVTDMLPDCVSLNGQITIEDALSTPIAHTTTGSLTININPSTQILPGNDFTITIPVVKSGGGNCCNESVSVTADMTTSGVELNANYGSPEAPAACVTGTECCDIADFEATIQENNGTFNVTINGGSVPLQEVEISMVDYHIAYSNEDCKPSDLGIFGTLNTTTTNLNNLILNSGDNGTSSLSWLLGNPSIINSSVNLDILYPDVLNLDCCEVEFYFCLKVKVKDVNCNVCETIICYSSDQQSNPEPCEIDIKPFSQGQKYCVGDTINLNWSGSTPSGQVNISLFDNTSGVVYSVLATGIPNTGTYSYTIPPSLPCNPPRSWSLIVEDAERLCLDRSDPFIIECCEQQNDCECGEWLTKDVTIKGYIKKIPRDPKLKINIPVNFEKKIECGDKIELKPNLNYNFTSPNYVCNPENCEVEYKWEVIDPNGIILSGNGQTFNYTFNNFGTYKVIFTPICGGNRCDPCVIYVDIKKVIIWEQNTDMKKFINDPYFQQKN